jgi:DNA polymerase I-like protein with 3'-5' exonuclease and polymerase domains
VLAPHLKKTLRKQLERCRPSYALYQAARNVFDRGPVFTLTARLREGAGYCARHNTVFQGLASCGAKLALWRLWRSRLLRDQGCRLVNFVHDENVLEVPVTADLPAVAKEVRTAMVEEMAGVVPGVKVQVKMGYRRRWGTDPADAVPVAGVR